MATTFMDFVIALSGTFESHNHKSLSNLLKDNGAKYTTKVNENCTHLVVSEKDFEIKAPKVKQALDFQHVKLVSVGWLLDSIKANRALDVGQYTMVNASLVAVKDEETGMKRSRNGKIKVESSESNEEEQQPPTKRQKDDQKAKPSSLYIPVDECCSLQHSHRVYIDEDSTIFDAALNQTNSGKNNNKFYRIQLLHSNGNYHTWTRWGRVGEHGQNALLGYGEFEDAMRQFEKKFKDKSGHSWADRLKPPKNNKYTFIERNYEPDSDEEDDLTGAGSCRESKTSSTSQSVVTVESALPKPVQRLMELIFNHTFFAATMNEMEYDANKIPLGKLSKRTLTSGFERLKELAELFAKPSLADEVHYMSYAEAIESLSNRYYTVIPHSFGRNRPPVISDDRRLKREIELLESLSDMEIANNIMKEAKEDVSEHVHPLDRQYAGLNLKEMTPLEFESSEFQHLEDYLLKTHGSTHHMHLKVQDIFRLERVGELDRFSKSPFANLHGDRRLLWHGSRCTNFGGILSRGLRIAPPEAPVSGYMFGKGIYLADISTKSAGYCASSSSGNIGLLLLCEAELGNPMLELTSSDYNAGEEARRRGYHATWGKGLTVPKGWKDASCVNKDLKDVIMPDTAHPPSDSGISNAYLQYNEFICYDVAQIRLRYLFRVEMGY